MQKCLLKHQQEHSPISDNHYQWGFSIGKSTTGAHLTAVDNWYRLLEAGSEVCAVSERHLTVCLTNCLWINS